MIMQYNINMKKLLIGSLLLLAILVPQSASALNLGLISIDLGIPVMYENTGSIADVVKDASNVNDIGSAVSVASAVFGNLRVGLEADFIFNIVPGIFGLGLNTQILLGIGAIPGAIESAFDDFILDIPIRLAARIAIPGVMYFQIHGGVALKNIPTAFSDINFDVFRHIDVGMRIVVPGIIGIEGGYLIAIEDIKNFATGTDLARILPSADEPFYIGLYIPIL